MVAAKLDHSRVLVTKFHQNRSTLKGRSAGQKHTDTHRQTNSAENKGPSGSAIGPTGRHTAMAYRAYRASMALRGKKTVGYTVVR